VARARVGLILVLAVISTVVALPAGAEPQPQSASLSMQITVSGLSDGLYAAVNVTGPDGYEEQVTGTKVLDSLTSGRYSVTASPVKDAGGTYWPVPSDWPHTWQTSVEVSTQEQSAVTINYADYVSSEVQVVPLGATESLVTAESSEELDVVRQAAGQTYRDGEILVSEPTPVAPDGYIVKVAKVEPSSDATLETLAVHPVPLEEAVPEADVDEHATLAMYTSIFESKQLSCKTGGDITLSAEFHVTPSFTLKATWGTRKHRSAELDAALNEDASSEIVSAAHTGCELRPVNLGPSVQLAPHGIVFFVGPVPVVITASLGVAAEGSVNVDAAFRAYVEQQAALGIHLYYPRVDRNFGAEFPHAFKVPFGRVTSGIDGSADVALVPELRVRLYGLTGPTVGVRLYVKLSVRPEERSLSVCARAQGHLHLPRFKKIAPWEGKAKCGKVLKPRSG
jgi:hypothetical protein